MSNAKFLLEHFYYGQPGTGAKPELLAASPGVTPALVEQCLERLKLPSLTGSAYGSWALIRGRSRQIPFLFVQAQDVADGHQVDHYIIPSPESLKAIGGNLSVLMSLLNEKPPTFKASGQKLKRLEVAQPSSLAVDDQIEDILELMTVTRNRTQIIEPLLAAIVQGTPLLIQGAPPDLPKRVKFISGLLALLPSSARFGVTFTTHSLPATDIDAQIRFYSDDEPPADTVIFNWNGASVSGSVSEDEYSHYIMSLLRLDTELVIERATAMASIAGWRLNEGDKLADALGYASKRFTVDEALKNNQPVDKDEVAKILEEDHTLSSDLRVMYASHLIRFSLAMNDMSHADPVAILLRSHPELAESTLSQMDEAVQTGQAEIIYDTLVSWMSKPLGPAGPEWGELIHRALMTLLKELVEEQEIEFLNEILENVVNADPALGIDQIAPRIIGITLPFCKLDADVARNVFLIGVRHLDTNGFQKLMEQADMVRQLPPQVKHAWAYIQEGKADSAPAGFLVQTARNFGANWEALVLIRYVELAVLSGQLGVLDTPTLRGLVQVATNPESAHYHDTLLALARKLDDRLLTRLEEPGACYVLQIYLAIGEYSVLAREMIRHSILLYAGDRQEKYIDAIHYVFSETTLTDSQVVDALRSIEIAGIKELPMAIAAIGAIQNQEATPDLNKRAAMATDYLLAARHVHEMVPPAAILGLVRYYSRAKDAAGMLRAASIVPLSARHQGTPGVKMLAETYQQLDWNDQARRAALQMLRVYVREANAEIGPKAAEFFAKELGDEVRTALEVTMNVNKLMGGMSAMTFARALRYAMKFLQESAAIYVNEKAAPNPHEISQAIDGMSGALTAEERRHVVRRLQHLGEGIIFLGKQYRANKARNEDEHVQKLFAGTEDPKSIIEIWWAIAGVLAKGKRIQLEIAPAPVSSFGSGRSVQNLYTELEACGQILQTAVDSLGKSKTIRMRATDIKDEIRSIWETLSEDDQTAVRRALASDLQRLADIVVLLEAQGDARAFEDAATAKKLESGKQKPRSALEFFRILYGYYAARS